MSSIQNNKEKSMANIKIFENKEIRTSWNEQEEEWYFSVVDVVEVLTDSPRPRKYWNALKTKLKEEGSELSQSLGRLKLIAKDGKLRDTDVLNTKGILRLVQSIPSKKAEPFKLWLAKVGAERLEEIADPEKAMQRGADFYRMKGYSPEWITQRLLSIKIRKELTDEWKERGIEKESDYAILTNELTKAWSGLSVKEYKKIKDLKKENLRDNMTDIELVLNMLAEVSTKTISQTEKPTTLAESKKVARQGGSVARTAKKDLEKRIGKSVISPANANKKELLTTNLKITNEDKSNDD